MVQQFLGESDKEAYLTLQGLINKNGGLWKSDLQKGFWLNRAMHLKHYGKRLTIHKQISTLEIDPDTPFVPVHGYYQVEKYEPIPFLFVFVLDDKGILGNYRVRGTKHFRKETIWERMEIIKEWKQPKKEPEMTEQEVKEKRKAILKKFRDGSVSANATAEALIKTGLSQEKAWDLINQL